MARIGCLSFWDNVKRKVIMFGGQNNGENKFCKDKMLLNDLLIYDPTDL